MIQKVEDIKEPLVVGKDYLVLCIIEKNGDIEYITPIINHPHSDKENGQEEIHYHADYRFVKCRDNENNFPNSIKKHSTHVFLPDHHIRITKNTTGYKFEYIALPCIRSEFNGITPVEYISKSKLKHQCIYKGKCPHRGYDLSQVKPKNGEIRCPLHGLRFSESTGKLLKTYKL